MKNSLNVLWVDDDSPKKVEGFEGVNIVTAQSCGEAERILKEGSFIPQWAVVDLIVPQGEWGESARIIPGLNYVNHLKNKYGDSLNILVFSIVITSDLRQKAIKAGAKDAYAKTSHSWAQIIRDLQNNQQSIQKAQGQL